MGVHTKTGWTLVFRQWTVSPKPEAKTRWCLKWKVAMRNLLVLGLMLTERGSSVNLQGGNLGLCFFVWWVFFGVLFVCFICDSSYPSRVGRWSERPDYGDSTAHFWGAARAPATARCLSWIFLCLPLLPDFTSGPRKWLGFDEPVLLRAPGAGNLSQADSKLCNPQSRGHYCIL